MRRAAGSHPTPQCPQPTPTIPNSSSLVHCAGKPCRLAPPSPLPFFDCPRLPAACTGLHGLGSRAYRHGCAQMARAAWVVIHADRAWRDFLCSCRWRTSTPSRKTGHCATTTGSLTWRRLSALSATSCRHISLFPFLRTGTSSTPCLPSLHWHPLAPTLYLRFVRHVHRRMQHLNALVSKHRLRANLLSHAEITPGSSTPSVS